MKHLYITLFFIVSFFSATYAQDEFITTWQTTSSNETITIPTTGSGYNYSVDWGDGTIEAGFTGSATHEYTVANTYTVEISGDFPRIYFNNLGDKDKIIGVNQWGAIEWASMESSFYGCTNLTVDTSDTPDLTNSSTLRAMFKGATNLIDVQETFPFWNVSTIVDFGQMFMNTDKFNTSLISWNFSVAEDFSEMFRGAKVFNQPLGNPFKAKTFEGMFRDAVAFNQPLFWYTPDVISLKNMFDGATSFDQNLGSFTISSVTDMTGMFTNAGLSTQNYDQTLSGWFVELNATDIRPENIIFDAGSSQYCMAGDIIEKLTNEHGWQITDSGASCDESDFFIMTWDLTSETTFTMPSSGNGYDYLLGLSDGGIYHMTSDVFQMGRPENLGIFTVRIYGDFPRFDFDAPFVDKEKLATIEQWGNLQLTEANGTFEGCTNLVLNATDTPDLSQIQFMDRMFENTSSFVDNGGEMNNWNVSTVTSMTGLFEGSTFNENINDWDVSKVEDFSSMFKNNTSFNQPLNNWNTEKANDLTNMFDGATAFNQPIGMWNTALAQYFDFMFLNASAFDQNLGNWDISNTDRNSMDGMLTGSAMSTANYDAMLIGWATLEVGETQIPTDVKLDADTFYCLSETARNTLTGTSYNWTINDLGNSCPEDAFITTWQTTTNNESITIPTRDSGYDYIVDWGDGTIETGFTGDAIHQYATAGTYTVKITGDFPRIRFNTSVVGNQSKIQTIEQWGTQQWDTFSSGFNGCVNLKLNADDTPDLSQVTQLSSMFESCTNFEDLKDTIGSWDVSTIERIDSMFTACSIFNEDISGWTFTNLLRTDSTFEEAFLFNQNISNWNMATVTDMAFMFYDATTFNQPIDNWDVSLTQEMEELFFGASSFDQDLSNWDISSVTNMTGIFTGAGVSQTNYDSILIGWATLAAGETQIPASLTLDVDVAHCSGVNAVSTLTSAPYNWTINDGGNGCDFTDAFITTWQTTTDNESITIPTTGAGYSYAVDWGDGTIEVAITGDATHSYATAGTYQVKITGTFPRIYFNNTGDKDKILAIEQWGTRRWQSMEAAFYGCTNLVLNALDTPDLSLVTTLASVFRDTTSFMDNGGEIGNWNTSTLEFLTRAFRGSAFNENINDWDISGVRSFIEMFRNASAFNQPLNNWDLTSATILQNMFNGATSFDQDLGNWDLSNISSSISISGLLNNVGMSTSNYDATLIGWATLDAGETQIPTGMSLGATGITYCLGEAARNILTSAPYNWNITDAGIGCAPTDAFITTWQTTDANQSIRIPKHPSSSGYNYSVDWGDGTQSFNQTGNANHEYASAGTYTVKIYGNFPHPYFDNAGTDVKPRLLTIEQWGIQQWTSMVSAFEDCPNLKLNADDNPDFSQLTNVEDMFRKCTNFEDLKDNIGSWDMSTVENISFMFDACTIFDEDITQWTFTNLKDAGYVFRNTTAFNQNISNWNVSTVETFESMFENATAFNQPIGTWTIGTVEYMISMFKNATAFNQDLSGWNMSNVEELEDMFEGASNFDQNLGGWDISNVIYMDEMFIGAGMSQANYDATLIGWATLETGETQIPADIDLRADATYCLAESARNILTSAPYNWTITDGGQGCISPIITLLGGNPQIIEIGDAYNELGAEVTYGATLTINTTSVTTNQVGSYTVTYDAINTVSGISATQVTRTVNVVDTTNPIVVCQNITVQLDDTGNASITSSMIDNGSTDLAGIASLVADITDFDCTNIGDNTIILTVTDTNGNSDMCMATVTVEDMLAPKFDTTTVPTDMEVIFDTGDMYTLADFTDGVVVTDNCDTNRTALATTITQSPVAGTLLGEGDHVITLTATDDNANEQTTTFTITVTDDVLSVGENTEDLFTLYPNPTTDQVWITGLNGEAQLTLFDINGRVLRTIKVKNDQSISTTDLSEGVYLIKIEQDDVYQTTRLIKN